MIKKLIKKIKKWIKESNENYKIRIIKQESVNCPHCNQYYSPLDIGNLEFETEIEDFSIIKCFNCCNIFGVKITRYYEPYSSMFRDNVKLQA